MNRYTVKWMSSAVLWTAVVALGVAGTARGEIRLMFWSLIVALVAAVMSGHIIAECAAQKACHQERLRIETLGDLIAAKAVERMDREDVTRIR